jgi:formylglycine-generating enzyme required for sulfatase activity
MRTIDAATFEMGTPAPQARHFCGETPRHLVQLSPYRIARYLVTNELYGLFDRARIDIPKSDRQNPVVAVSWFEAFVYAMWMGCRLPTEAEWEFACGAGRTSDWCCDRENEVAQYAWYSENAGGQIQPVATRDPNSLGLFDLHGNVWEWCIDTYAQDYYRESPALDPICTVSPTDSQCRHNVCRGGSVHALAEMCRTRYRLHEPPNFSASDLGFRLVAAEYSTNESRRA